jgi:DNA-binding CsgD family transcriptional regulator
MSITNDDMRVRSQHSRQQQSRTICVNIMLCLAAGITETQIARRRHVAVGTVSSHLTRWYRRFDVNSKYQLLAVFIQRGDITPEMLSEENLKKIRELFAQYLGS